MNPGSSSDITHAADQVPILSHRVGRRIFVNDCPFESSESNGTSRVAAAGLLNWLLDMHVVAAGVFQVKAASGPVLNPQFSGDGGVLRLHAGVDRVHIAHPKI